MEFTKYELQCIRKFEDDCAELEKSYLKPQSVLCGSAFHYTSLEGLSGILETKKLHFTECSYLNDSSEGDYVFEVLDDALNDYQINHDIKFINGIRKALQNKPYDEIYDEKCKYYFVCCFSTEQDSLSLWNYYTKNLGMQGFNLKFDLAWLWKNIEKLCSSYGLAREPYIVLYKKTKQKKYIHTILDSAYGIWKSGKCDKIFRFIVNYFNSIRFAFKHPAFSAENELRFVIKMNEFIFDREIALRANGRQLVKVRVKKDSFAPYIEVPIESECIVAVTSSPLVKNDLINSIRILLKRNGFSDTIPIIPSGIPLRY